MENSEKFVEDAKAKDKSIFNICNVLNSVQIVKGKSSFAIKLQNKKNKGFQNILKSQAVNQVRRIRDSLLT